MPQSLYNKSLKGALSQGFSQFWVKIVLNAIVNSISHAGHAPRTLKERNSMIFSKGEQTITT